MYNTFYVHSIFELHLLEEEAVGSDVPLISGDEVLPGVAPVHGDHVCVLHVDPVLDQHLVFLATKHEGGCVILSNGRIRGAVDTLTRK